MSGVEAVAGLVLGGFPLLISAIEHYQECFQVLGCWREFRHEYRICRNRIRQMQLEYDLLLDKILFDGSESPDDLAQLRSGIDKADWTRLETKLKSRLLPRVYQSYMDTMRDMGEAMQDLHEELGFQKPLFHGRMEHEQPRAVHSLGQRVRSRVSFEAQRTKFSLGKARRDEFFGRIEWYNRSLGEILLRNDEVTRLVRRSSSRKTNAATQKGLLDFWRHAKVMHTLLSRAMKCPCQADHSADLLLEFRLDATVTFQVLLRAGKSTNTAPMPHAQWSQQYAVISKIDHLLPDAECVKNAKSGSSRTLKRDMTIPIRSANCNAKRVRINSAGGTQKAAQRDLLFVTFQASPGASSTATLTRSSAESLESNLELFSRVPNLCQELSILRDGSHASMLLAVKDVPAQFQISYATHAHPITSQTDSVSLMSLLEDHKIDRAHRYRIAATVASSQLQLHSTPWLGKRWSANDVTFEIQDGQVQIDGPRLRNALLSKGHTLNDCVDETFMTLGIILLELCFGTPLSQSPFRTLYTAPNGRPDAVMDCAAAQRWADLVEGEAGPDFADAIEWCLRRRRMRSHDDDWRQQLQESVVEPIWRSFEKLTST